MTSSDKELEEQLLAAGNKLLQSPSSVDELLPLLDQVENCLSRVEQSPPKSMQHALSPSLKALVAKNLLRHSDVDVKVAVASCISEITRITAPEAPYDDEQMKEVFKLIVSSFERLSDKSSRSYNKRALILETVAKVRSCVVMLDLECDALILEMFQHFLKTVRDHHPENVFSSMEMIMTLVIEESEDISQELLSPLLAALRKDNEEVQPIAWKLAEKVLENCASKLKPSLVQAVESSGISLNDYSEVVVSICREKSAPVEHHDGNASADLLGDEVKLVKAPEEEADQVPIETAREEAGPGVDNSSSDKSPKSAMRNGITETEMLDSSIDPKSSDKLEHNQHNNQPDTAVISTQKTSDKTDSGGKLVSSEPKLEETTKRRSKKLSPSIKPTEPSEASHIDGAKEGERLPEKKVEEVSASPCEDQSLKDVAENEKETTHRSVTEEPLESGKETDNVASKGPTPEMSRFRKGSRGKKKEDLVQESTPVVAKKASEGTSDSEAKKNGRFKNKDLGEKTEDDSRKEGGTITDSKERKLKLKQVVQKNEDGLSTKKHGEHKRQGRGKAKPEKDLMKSSAKEDDLKAKSAKDVVKSSVKDEDVKDMVSTPKAVGKSTKDDHQIEEIPRISSKRKRTPAKERESDSIGFANKLVGARIKVWWPDDHEFYEGSIESFDPVARKHRVLYTDGDEETLDLLSERWEFVTSQTIPEREQTDNLASHDAASSDMDIKKKAKTSSDQSAKQKKMDSLPKSGSTSKKSKGSGSRKSDSKTRDVNPKMVGKSEADGGKSKERTPRTGKPKDDNDDDAATPKTPSIKFKGAPATKSKTKTPLQGSNGKVKARSKGKEIEEVKEKSSSAAKTPEISTPKSQKEHEDGETKAGKKRRRGMKG